MNFEKDDCKNGGGNSVSAIAGDVTLFICGE
jgi:hypothetical protein